MSGRENRKSPIVRAVLQIDHEREEPDDVQKDVSQKPEVPEIERVIGPPAQIGRCDNEKGTKDVGAEDEGYEDPDGPFFEQLLPVAAFQGEADAHSGDQE
jgi:hypothetical protein